jgi:hypothetical protein
MVQRFRIAFYTPYIIFGPAECKNLTEEWLECTQCVLPHAVGRSLNSSYKHVIAVSYFRAVEVPFEFIEHDAEAEADPVRDHVDKEGGCNDDPTVAAVLSSIAVARPCKMSQFRGQDAA